jgi:hypothetical protein
MLQHNCLAALPAGLYSLSGLSTLDLSFNCLLALQQRIANMQGLQVMHGPIVSPTPMRLSLA